MRPATWNLEACNSVCKTPDLEVGTIVYLAYLNGYLSRKRVLPLPLIKKIKSYV